MDTEFTREESRENPVRPGGSRKIKWFSLGFAPSGVVAVGVVPMGVVAVGVVPMGVVAVGSVAMGTIAAGLVSMGLFTIGNVSMSLNKGHHSNVSPAPTETPHEHHP